jgi:hypothetical protein
MSIPDLERRLFAIRMDAGILAVDCLSLEDNSVLKQNKVIPWVIF